MGSRRGHEIPGRLGIGLLVSALTLLLVVPTADAASPKTKLVSRGGGVQADADSFDGGISASGRFVAFHTEADNLDAADANGLWDVYVRDVKQATTSIVSVSSSGRPANGNSWDSAISASGRFVVFESAARNLIDGSWLPAYWQIYLRDRSKGKTYLISKNSAGGHAYGDCDAPDISADGRFVVFISAATNLTAKDTKGQRQVYLRDRKLKKTVLISRNNAGKAGNAWSYDPAMSRNGRVIVWSSSATNLVPKDKDGLFDIFRRDRVTQRTTRVSRNWKGRPLVGGSQGAEYPNLSANGRYLVFESDATNATKGGASGDIDLIYRRDLKTGEVRLVSRSNRGARANDATYWPSLSADGRYAVFHSFATNLVPGGDANGAIPDALRRGPYE